MSQSFWLQIFLNYILSFVSKEIDKIAFRKYLIGLIYQEKSFSVRKISKNTEKKTIWQLYDFLESKIHWKNLFYQLAKLIFPVFKALNFYLTVDGTPLRQKYATHRIAKHGFISIAGKKNILQNQSFNPRSCVRSDQDNFSILFTASLLFQSTLLREERHRPNILFVTYYLVSIHAPV